MKQLAAIAAAVMLFTTPVKATPVCDSFGEFAETVMTMRQAGVPFEETINAVPDTSNQSLNEVFFAVVVAAFSKEQYKYTNDKVEAINKFKQFVILTCLSSYGEQL